LSSNSGQSVYIGKEYEKQCIRQMVGIELLKCAFAVVYMKHYNDCTNK